MNHERAGLREAIVVWAIYAATLLAIFITYARVPADEMYHTSHEGLAGGASRALTFANFSFSLGALALLGFAVARSLTGPLGQDAAKRRAIVAAAIVAALLCLVTALPGVVDQGDLDARSVNAIPALGVAIAAALTLLAFRTSGAGPAIPWTGRDHWRWIAIAIITIVASPWILADLGVYTADISPFDGIVMSKELRAEDGDLKAVHLGHHHGLDGAIFAVAALLLGRQLPRLRPRGLQTALAWYLSLMLCYGLANLANDAWLEQIVKRGWTDRSIPSMLRPDLTLAWLILILVVVAVRFTLFRVPPGAELGALGDPSVEPRPGHLAP